MGLLFVHFHMTQGQRRLECVAFMGVAKTYYPAEAGGGACELTFKQAKTTSADRSGVKKLSLKMCGK
jgi:hypothetical protein